MAKRSYISLPKNLLLFPLVFIDGNEKDWQVFRSNPTGWVPCWVGGNLTRDRCCGDENFAPDACQMDEYFITRKECCLRGWAIIDPQEFTEGPPVKFPPSGRSWDDEEHPSLQIKQRQWEAIMMPASVTRWADSPFGSTQVVVYKGDRADIHLYGLENATFEKPAERIVDIGGNYGAVSIFLATVFPTAQIVVLEPNPLLCRFLLLNLRLHQLTSRVWPICAAFGSGEGELSMETCNQPWLASTKNTCINLGMRTFPREESERMRNAKVSASGHVIDVPTLSMEKILEGVGWQSADILKIDCEGCEWSTLLEPRRSWHVTRAVGEVHFGCKDASCWPKIHDGNCTTTMFSSLAELNELVERCEKSRAE
eukprot:TRINITY_DN4368_c0_g2_i2.p1 TRINITY_DN4368_c0_g2~~TRINITY_DN4368_c0_g2_i2.p1  ORF type:complete len:386 (+),score=58.05 TRINITY_DN4368_c0_g2_i2:57-1160(+)